MKYFHNCLSPFKFPKDIKILCPQKIQKKIQNSQEHMYFATRVHAKKYTDEERKQETKVVGVNLSSTYKFHKLDPIL